MRYYGIPRSRFASPPQYNIAPTHQVAVVISDGKGRRIGPLVWGLIPHEYAQDPNYQMSAVQVKANMQHKVANDRMPVIVRDFQDERFWLDKDVRDTNNLLSVLKPYPGDDMYVYPVSKAVMNTSNNSTELIQEIPQ